MEDLKRSEWDRLEAVCRKQETSASIFAMVRDEFEERSDLSRVARQVVEPVLVVVGLALIAFAPGEGPALGVVIVVVAILIAPLKLMAAAAHLWLARRRYER